MELEFGYGKAGHFGESAAWFMEYEEAQEERLDFQDEWGIPDCPGCGSPPPPLFALVAMLTVGVGRVIVGTPG